MARPIHHFLREFPSGDEPMPEAAPKLVTVSAVAPAPPPAPDVMAKRIDDAYQQGVAAGRVIERQEIETQATVLSVDFERRLEDTMRRFSTALAERLAGELHAGIDNARLALSSHVATALVPFLRAGVTKAAIESFVAELGDMVEMADAMTVEVACPAELIEPLREALGEAMAKRGAPPGSVRCIPGEASEIRVALGETVLETRLAEWLARLDGVLR